MTITSPTTIPLARLIAHLVEHYNGDAPTYLRLHRAAIECRIPMELGPGRLRAKSEHVPVIAAYFGLTPKAPARSKARSSETATATD
jgi:hypothetical protein